MESSRIPEYRTKAEIDQFLKDERQAKDKETIDSFKSTRRKIEARISPDTLTKRENQVRGLYIQGLGFIANFNPKVKKLCETYWRSTQSSTPQELQMICDEALREANMLSAVSAMPERLRTLHLQGLDEKEFNEALRAMQTAFVAAVKTTAQSLTTGGPAPQPSEASAKAGPKTSPREQKIPEREPSLSMNFYEILGVTQAADTNQIRKAFRQKALQMHPDKHPTEKEKYEALFKLLNQAQATLVNPIERAKYDREMPKASKQAPVEKTKGQESKFANTSKDVGLMIFSERDARLRALEDVGDAFNMLVRFFQDGTSGLPFKVASNQAAVAEQFEKSEWDMQANMFERHGWGVTGRPLCVVEFSISDDQIKKLRQDIQEAEQAVRSAGPKRKQFVNSLTLLRDKLASSISSLMISEHVVKSQEDFNQYEDHLINDPVTNKKFLLFTREELMEKGLIPKLKIGGRLEEEPALLTDGEKKKEGSTITTWITSLFKTKDTEHEPPNVLALKGPKEEKKDNKM